MYRQIVLLPVKLPSLMLCPMHLPIASRQLYVKTQPRILSGCFYSSNHGSHSKSHHRTALKRKKMLQSKQKKNRQSLDAVIAPVKVAPTTSKVGEDNIGLELAGSLSKVEIWKILNTFFRDKSCAQVAAENGVEGGFFRKAFMSFKHYCTESDQLPADLHIILKDISSGSGHVSDVLPYFVEHARTMFPHLNCLEDLKKISDLRHPSFWYPAAREMQRKIIYHAGPTNSGKTYHALQRFLKADSGVYCGPLRLLANEIFHKSNNEGTPCDLVTGEERICIDPKGHPACHVACTVEMTSIDTPYEVAVVDEIQMLRDEGRGWAWTRVVLGLCAEEIHLCGEASAIDFVQEIAELIGDTFEVKHYNRLTPLEIMDKPLGNLSKVQPGDAIVCFSRSDIYKVSRALEQNNIQSAVIYGALPPGTKVAQAANFNDPDHPCKVIVATDAIGMGLNLSIKRVIFYSLVKPTVNEEGQFVMESIKPSEALQIGGRAGRFGMAHSGGSVTTYSQEDLPALHKLLETPVEPIQKAGLQPTAEQIELFAYHLPKASLSNLIDIFMMMCSIDNDRYFMCRMEDFKTLADIIESVPLDLRVRYVFCCSPISVQKPFVLTSFLMFARRFSKGYPLTKEWMGRMLNWPPKDPATLADLVHLEDVFDILDLYLWLGYRFPDMFCHMDEIRAMQGVLEEVIHRGVQEVVKLIQNSKKAESADQSGKARRPSDLDITRSLKRRGIISDLAWQEMENAMRDDNYGNDSGNGTTNNPR